MNRKTDIYTLAYQISPKPKKAEIFKKIQYWIENEKLPDDTDLAVLYAHFIPSVPAKAKSPCQWVAQAVPKADARFCLNWVYVDDRHRVCGTDGHRLHVWQQTPMPDGSFEFSPGYYDIKMNPAEDRGMYPYIDGVIPSEFPRIEDQKEYFFKALKVQRGDMSVSNPVIDGYVLEEKDSLMINTKYLKQAANQADSILLTGKKDTGAHRFAGPFDGCFSVVMGMRK